jgi:hypothetical protein
MLVRYIVITSPKPDAAAVPAWAIKKILRRSALHRLPATAGALVAGSESEYDA